MSEDGFLHDSAFGLELARITAANELEAASLAMEGPPPPAPSAPPTPPAPPAPAALDPRDVQIAKLTRELEAARANPYPPSSLGPRSPGAAPRSVSWGSASPGSAAPGLSGAASPGQQLDGSSFQVGALGPPHPPAQHRW